MLVLKPGMLIDGTGAPPRRGQAVSVEHGRIEWIGPAGELAATPDVQLIEAPNATLLPGLIDCHVHLMCPAERCEPATYLAASDQELLVRAVAKAQAGLRAGMTTMRDLGSREFLLSAVRDAIAAGHLQGPRLVLAGPAITRTGGHFHYLGLQADTAEELAAAVCRVCEGGADVVKIMATGGRTTIGTDPEAPQYSAEQLRVAVEQAHALGRRFTAHAHGVEGIRNAVAAGVDCLEHCSWVGPGDRTAYDPGLAERIVDQGIYVSPTFGYRARLSAPELLEFLPPGEGQRAADNQETRFAAMREMIALDAMLLASSDAGMPNTHTHDFAHTLWVLVERLGMSPLRAIRAATSLAAEALGIARETGAIAKGKAADLLLVDGDPSTDITTLQRVHTVIRKGNVV
ncbi:MAG TPA: amidohydrolase family protein [Chloroflexota bacterium]